MPVVFPVWPLWMGGTIHFRHVALGNKIKASGKAQTLQAPCAVFSSPKAGQWGHKHPAPPAAQAQRCPGTSLCCWDTQLLNAECLNQAVHSKNSLNNLSVRGVVLQCLL